jgi:hypothetical protein
MTPTRASHPYSGVPRCLDPRTQPFPSLDVSRAEKGEDSDVGPITPAVRGWRGRGQGPTGARIRPRAALRRSSCAACPQPCPDCATRARTPARRRRERAHRLGSEDSYAGPPDPRLGGGGGSFHEPHRSEIRTNTALRRPWRRTRPGCAPWPLETPGRSRARACAAPRRERVDELPETPGRKGSTPRLRGVGRDRTRAAGGPAPRDPLREVTRPSLHSAEPNADALSRERA